MKKNIPGWFPTTNQETLEKLISEHNIETVIEIGSFVGLSTVFFAERVKKVYAVDPFDAITRINYLHGEMKVAAEKQYENFLENTKGFDNIEVLQMTSEKAADHLSMFLEADLIYIDGSHEYKDVKKDIEMWFPRAVKILCGDDYTESWPGVRKAVDECGRDVNKNQRVWYIIK
jgi:predicted O-methyltransferase YrrM